MTLLDALSKVTKNADAAAGCSTGNMLALERQRALRLLESTIRVLRNIRDRLAEQEGGAK